MPELPEVETIRRDLTDLIIGEKILEIDSDSPKQVKPSLEQVKKAVVGAKINQIKRRAKLLLLHLSNGKILAIHLKLTGRLLVRKKGEVKDSWQHITVFLTGNKELRFADLRKFGWIKLTEKGGLDKLLSEFGPEPLDDLTLKEFQKILSRSARPIKIVLMDQKMLSGIGNIYAVDALNLAKIHPKKPAKDLNNNEVKKLFDAVEKVLKAGIKYRGASDQYYLDALGQKGGYQDHFLVYGRTGEKCFNCGGIVEKFFLGGRGTFFCPVCQKV